MDGALELSDIEAKGARGLKTATILTMIMK